MEENEKLFALINVAREQLIEPYANLSLKDWADVMEKALITAFNANSLNIDRHVSVKAENLICDIKTIAEGSDVLKEKTEPEVDFYDEFLDARTCKKKIEILKQNRNKLNDKIISDFAVSLDVVVDEGDIDERFYSLMNCLNQMAKFESEGLR